MTEIELIIDNALTRHMGLRDIPYQGTRVLNRARGFLVRSILSALRDEGYRVVRGVKPVASGGDDAIA